MVFTDNVLSIEGYNPTDINGDGFIEIEDLVIVQINQKRRIISIIP